MKTLYIDIYFLINFVIDLVALHFAAMFTKIKISNKRILISSVLGAISACITVFLRLTILDIIISVISLVGVIFICTPKIGYKRRLALGISLLIFLSLIGGVVSFVWDLLSGIFSGYILENDVVNRNMLFLSLIILLSMGVLKMFITVLNGGKIDTKIEFQIKFLNKQCTSEALIDTGNLAMDPLGMKPVLIIKEKLAKDLLPISIIELKNIDDLDREIKKRIRLIPLSKGGITHVYIGVVPNEVSIIKDGKKEIIDVTVVIDKDGGDFGGFMALMPFSAIKNVFS